MTEHLTRGWKPATSVENTFAASMHNKLKENPDHCWQPCHDWHRGREVRLIHSVTGEVRNFRRIVDVLQFIGGYNSSTPLLRAANSNGRRLIKKNTEWSSSNEHHCRLHT